MFWLIGTAFALRNFLTNNVGGVSAEFFEKIAFYWFLEGSGHLEKFRARTKKKEPKKIEKCVENFIFRCGFEKNVFGSKTERFSYFFSFSALGARF